MIAFNTSTVNLKSPYYVIKDADGDLLFETDYGVKYGISFELNDGMMNYPVYEFGILNKNGRPSPNDRKLRDTILAIIEEFFTSNGGVLLYICATGDGISDSVSAFSYVGLIHMRNEPCMTQFMVDLEELNPET